MFFDVRLLDIVDILVVAFLLYQMYRILRGTAAISIFAGVISIYALWFVVRALKMELLSAILGQILGVGILVLVIIFQQEIRKFLLYIGTQYFVHHKFSLQHLFFRKNKQDTRYIDAIVRAAQNMSGKKTGALIVIRRRVPLDSYTMTGDRIDAVVSSRLLENIFFKNSPLHDGAAIIESGRISTARCVLPITERLNLPAHYGMRHRAAIGVSEMSDAAVVVVSEETGEISFVAQGNIQSSLSTQQLQDTLTQALAK
jgi:uncharacterized protein (TIGR00159 family)